MIQFYHCLSMRRKHKRKGNRYISFSFFIIFYAGTPMETGNLYDKILRSLLALLLPTFRRILNSELNVAPGFATREK